MRIAWLFAVIVSGAVGTAVIAPTAAAARPTTYPVAISWPAYAFRPAITLSARQAAFLSWAQDAARSSQRRYGVPASVVLAQAILETGWGRSRLARTAHNYFGMTCARGRPGPVAAGCRWGPDRVCDPDGCRSTILQFRMYRSAGDSFRDHGRQFATARRYATAYAQRRNADRFVLELHRAGYATDPYYARTIIKIMTKYDLYRLNRR